MHKMRLKSQPLRIEPANRTSRKALSQLSYRKAEPFWCQRQGKNVPGQPFIPAVKSARDEADQGVRVLRRRVSRLRRQVFRKWQRPIPISRPLPITGRH
jgi:hypothetical protein